MPNTAPLAGADALETLLASPLALEETAPSTRDIGVAESGALRTPASTSLRTTVLPRVAMIDAKPQLVVERKRRFEAVRSLGEGGHGEVTGARDHDIGREVAIKRLRAGMRASGAALRFAEEVRTVGQLEHPNIVPIHDVGIDENDEYFFVMKYVEGETLEAVIEKLAAGDREAHARYGFERRVQIFVGILEAVAYAHSKGILHRDIKPANVMVGAYGEVCLMDWGVATRKDQEPLTLPKAGELVGTPAYMSPEQARGETIDQRSDVYALCLVFHELLCLRHPLEEKATLNAVLHAVSHEPVPNATFVRSPHQPPVPAELGWFVRKGLAKDPAQRFQSVNEMIERLELRAEGSFPIQCPITFSKRVLGGVRRFVDHHPLLTSVALFASVAVLLVASVSAVLRALH
jgi:serine/threonine-protein kinase